MRAALLILAMAACGSPSPANLDAAPDAAPDAAILLSYGERCGDRTDDDGDGLADEDCEQFFGGVFAPMVSADPALAAIEAATGRPLSVLQTYHATTALGISRTGPDLMAIFARGQVAHLNIEPQYEPAQYASPTLDPIARDLAAMGDEIASVLADVPHGRILLTFGAEMNGNWTAWGCLEPATFVALYREAHRVIVRALVARGVDPRRMRWVWGPDSRGTASCATAAEYYPGHDVVDAIGLSAYRADTETVEQTVVAPMTSLFTALAYPTEWQRDRFIVLQTGSRDVASRNAFVRDLFTTLADDPRTAGVLYFDAADWAVAPDGNGWMGLVDSLAALPVADRQLEATFAPHFWDVPYGFHAYGEIQALADAGITAGCATAPKRFCPDDTLDRRGAAVLAARAFDLPDGDGPPRFVDVPADDPAFGAIQALAARGAMAGCAADRFCPDDTLDEAALAQVLVALGGTPPLTVDSVAKRGRAAVLIARAARLEPKPL